LGFTIERGADGFLLSQSRYVSQILARFKMQDSKLAVTPMDPSQRASLTEKKPASYEEKEINEELRIS
jgi:hypothetical protein